MQDKTRRVRFVKFVMSVLILVLVGTGGCSLLPDEQLMAPDHDDRYNNAIVQDAEKEDTNEDNSPKLKIPVM